MSIENVMIGFLILADVALVGLVVSGMVAYRKKGIESQNQERENRKSTNNLNT